MAVAIGGVSIVAISGHAGHIVHNGGSRAENAIEEGRFTHIGTPHEGDNGQATAFQREERCDGTTSGFGA